MSVAILTKEVEVSNNARNESCTFVCGKHVRGENHGPEKGAYNDIFLIASYKHKHKILLL